MKKKNICNENIINILKITHKFILKWFYFIYDYFSMNKENIVFYFYENI